MKLFESLRQKKKQLQKIAIGLGLAAALSWYLCSYIHILSKTKTLVLNPFSFFKYFDVYGFPGSAFRWLFLFLSAIILYIFFLRSSAKDGVDEARNFKYSKSGVYGTAKLLDEAGMQDVAQAQPIDEAMGIILGRMDNTDKRIINMKESIRINKHVCVFGASQSGKTYCYSFPFMLQAARRRESLIVTDPKGELYETTSTYFRERGYVVRRFDLKRPALSDGWACLNEIIGSDDISPEDRATIFADIIIQNTKDPGGNSGGIFDDAPKALLTALLLRITLDPQKYAPDGRFRFSSLLDELKHPQGADHLQGEVFADSEMPDEAKVCLRYFHTFLQASPNLYGNLITGLASRLSPLETDTVREILETDDIDMSLPGQRPCVYYCIMSDMHRTNNFLGALFYSFLFLDLVEFADALQSRRCPVVVNFLLDEFANIGSIPDFDQKIAVIRSRGLLVSIILQDISQLKNRYPRTWLTILSNCATHLCIGFNDPETAKYYAERAGQTTVTVRTDQHAAIEPLIQLGRKHSTGDGRRNVLSTDELFRMDKDEVLISWQGHNSMKAYKFPVDLHPEFKFMKPCNYLDYPKIDDKEGRMRLREEEFSRIAEYESSQFEKICVNVNENMESAAFHISESYGAIYRDMAEDADSSTLTITNQIEESALFDEENADREESKEQNSCPFEDCFNFLGDSDLSNLDF